VVALHTGIAIVIAVGLIIWLKVDPVISPNPMSSPTSVMISPKPTAIASIVPVKPRTDRSVSPLRRSVPQAA